IGDGRAVEAESAGELFLGTSEAIQIVAEGGRLLQRVEILALKVLDHGELADALVVELEDPGGDFGELGLDAGAEPALARDELVAAVEAADQDRLEHSVLAQGVGERGDLGG